MVLMIPSRVIDVSIKPGAMHAGRFDFRELAGLEPWEFVPWVLEQWGLGQWGLEQWGLEPSAAAMVLFAAAIYGTMGVLSVLTYLGYGQPRVWLLVFTSLGIVATEYGRLVFNAEHTTILGGLPGLALNVLTLLLLTTGPARTWSRRTADNRRAQRRATGRATD